MDLLYAARTQRITVGHVCNAPKIWAISDSQLREDSAAQPTFHTVNATFTDTSQVIFESVLLGQCAQQVSNALNKGR